MDGVVEAADARTRTEPYLPSTLRELFNPHRNNESPLAIYGTFGTQWEKFEGAEDEAGNYADYAPQALMAAEGRHDPVNLGNPVEFTIRELADEVADAVGSEVRLAHRPLPQDDPTQRKPDITRAREWLGWEPQVHFGDGLKQTVEWYRDNPAWWEPIRSGDYRAYYERQYGRSLG